MDKCWGPQKNGALCGRTGGTPSRTGLLVNLVYSSVPTFYLSALKFPSKVLKQIDKSMEWRWYKPKKGGYLVAWSKAYLPKVEGGLCIINLKTQNKHSSWNSSINAMLKLSCRGCIFLGIVYTRLTLHLMQQNLWDPSGGEIKLVYRSISLWWLPVIFRR